MRLFCFVFFLLASLIIAALLLFFFFAQIQKQLQLFFDKAH